jgi:hypothetical protein
MEGERAASPEKCGPFSAEEERFELPDPLRDRRFSNSRWEISEKCTEMHDGEVVGASTTRGAPRDAERHRDHAFDQDSDHLTRVGGPRVEAAAVALLEAIAAGDEASFGLAEALANEVLADPVVKRARAVLELVAGRSPFALVRALELAERVIGADEREAIRLRGA